MFAERVDNDVGRFAGYNKSSGWRSAERYREANKEYDFELHQKRFVFDFGGIASELGFSEFRRVDVGAVGRSRRVENYRSDYETRHYGSRHKCEGVFEE